MSAAKNNKSKLQRKQFNFKNELPERYAQQYYYNLKMIKRLDQWTKRYRGKNVYFHLKPKEETDIRFNYKCLKEKAESFEECPIRLTDDS